MIFITRLEKMADIRDGNRLGERQVIVVIMI